jgi:hypothetical protein
VRRLTFLLVRVAGFITWGMVVLSWFQQFFCSQAF